MSFSGHYIFQVVQGGHFGAVIIFFWSNNKGEGDLTLDEKRVLILTAFFELEALNLVRSVPVSGYLIY